MISNVKAKIAAGFGALALVGGGAAVLGGATASAATPSCGTYCYDIFTQKYGTSFLLDNNGQHLTSGNQQMLWPATNNDPAEDYTIDTPGNTVGVLGTVNQLDHADPGLIPNALKVAYGNDYAFEIEASPDGANSSMCAGTWPGELASSGFKVRLEPCGYTNTIWIADESHYVTDHHSSAFGGKDYPLIAAETGSVSDPLVINYPGYPTDSPHPWITVSAESNYAGGAVYNNQEIGAKIGPVS